ncbi:HSF-type DNA-binding-domain-containing protein [Tribonema minus]|uniref:HSF-type DNA-binding-domain-containing protein n=1 Tax=Tribonema minus TaxID=303371 RepID=A0A836CRK9_9STRA|nr:HSF-type DNA-binding-domain-containing protein [Tribonema minus]
MPTMGDYTMRAQPRRRKEQQGDEPVFLRKTYEMINTCDTSLASWSARGDTFIIKSPERFAAEVIPTFFKHSKFASFVRQLNFYGFRKVKSALPLGARERSAAADADTSQWWEFKHDLFARDAPHLLSAIRRATHYVAPPEKEVDALKGEVSTLQARIVTMDERISSLTTLPEPVYEDGAAFVGGGALQRQPAAATADALLRGMSIGGGRGGGGGSGSGGFFDSELLDGLGMSTGLEFMDFDAAPEGGAQHVPAEPSPREAPPPAQRAAAAAAAAPARDAEVADLAASLSRLPSGAQAKLAEGLLALLQRGDAAAAEAGDSALAAAAAADAAQTAAAAAAAVHEAAAAAAPDAPEIAMPLASAALGAFLTHFAHRRGLGEPLMRTLSAQAGTDALSTPAPLHQPVI